ncbi:MAG: Gfo/Idh/MocA family oxidoreductase [Pirellulales bacterium]|nr:Gfo/Idh/MocA family oxidoreductase [Pirellulales bacterium]
MQNDKVRFGILGCARIVRRAMHAGIEQSGVATTLAIASRDRDLGAAWAREFAIPRHYDSYEALIDDPDIDAVYIPLPNELHRPWTLRAAAAGKHVLCEKPLGLTAEDAADMVEACRQHGVILMEAFMWRHHPRVTRVRQMLADGTIGDLRLVKLDFSFDIDRGDWRLDPQHGGGAVCDLGCYGINAARLFAGCEPKEVYARGVRYESGVDMTLSAQLVFPNGVMALFDSSFECPFRCRLEIVGTKGAVELPGGVLPDPEATLIVTTEAGTQTVRFPAAQQYAEQVKAFCAGIANGRLSEPAEGGLANMRVLDAVRTAAGLELPTSQGG